MMYYCIINTITGEVKSKILNETNQYVINGINLGPLLFKFLITVVTIDTVIAIINMQMDLTNLDLYILVV